jgi:UV DNA damage endonuclease
MDSTAAHAYRFGFAVKVLGNGGLKTHDARRWQNGPHLARSLELLDVVFDYLERIDVRVYRLSSSTVPYGTHPDLPELNYRRQIEACASGLTRVGGKAHRLGLRLSTHPGQYSVLNAVDEEIARKARLDVEQDALLLDALGQGPEAVVVVHVGGVYADRAAALDRWARSYERLSDRARRRLVLEHDETCFDVGDVLELHRRTGVPVVYDHHHHRCNPAAGLGASEALAAACATWPAGVRPKVHLSSPRTEFTVGKRGAQPPRPDQHADFVTPWDAVELLRIAPGPLDVILEAKAKDVAVLWLRNQLMRRAGGIAACEERGQRCDADGNGKRPVSAKGALPWERGTPVSSRTRSSASTG